MNAKFVTKSATLVKDEQNTLVRVKDKVKFINNSLGTLEIFNEKMKSATDENNIISENADIGKEWRQGRKKNLDFKN